MFGVLFAIFVVLICLNYMFLDIKVDKIKKDSLNKDQVIASLIAHNKALCKLNNGFKDHEKRIDDIEERLSLLRAPEQPEYTCKDCTYYHPYNGIKRFRCKKSGCSFTIECNKACSEFEKADGLDEDEDTVYYANNVKVDISSKKPGVYTVDRILTNEEWSDRISRLFIDGCISYADMNMLLERLKQ